MKTKLSIVFAMYLTLVCSPCLYGVEYTDRINWDDLSETFVNSVSDYMVRHYTVVDDERTAWDMWATEGTFPASGPYTFWHIYRTQSKTNYERMVFEADGRGFNFGIEHGGTGSPRDVSWYIDGYEALRMTTSGNFQIRGGRTKDIINLYQPDLDYQGNADSHSIKWVGKGYDTSVHTAEWKAHCLMDGIDGDSDFAFSHQKDSGGYTDKLVITDGGDYEVPGAICFAGTSALTGASTITVSKSFHTVNCSSNFTVTTINGGVAGDVVTFMKTGNGTCTFSDSGTNVQTQSGFTLNNTHDNISFIYDGSTWLEIARGDSN